MDSLHEGPRKRVRFAKADPNVVGRKSTGEHWFSRPSASLMVVNLGLRGSCAQRESSWIVGVCPGSNVENHNTAQPV